MAIGLGIHGEPGISEAPILPAAELAALLVDRLAQEAAPDGGSRVAVILNGLGSTKQEELFVLWMAVAARLRGHGLVPVSPLVGEYVTSLDMEGCSLTLTWLDGELERYWVAPCDTAVLSVGKIEGAPAAADDDSGTCEAPVAITPGSPESQACGKKIAIGFERLAAALKAAEAELGRIDAQAGDGDHGQGMARGSAAAAAAARGAADAGAGAATVLGTAANAWADRAGGTSGAIWGLGLLAASQSFSDQAGIGSPELARAANQALERVLTLGRARPGDKTLVDAFVPFVETLTAQLVAGQAAAAAWAAAAGAAVDGAESTAQMVPRIGRARPLAERSLGHRDAGAVSFALSSRVVAQIYGENHV
jgi:dihydroxyacetone kinase